MTRLVFFVCIGAFVFTPVFASASVVINEIAWMGTLADPNGSYCEWIELLNTENVSINLDGWVLRVGSVEKTFSIENSAAILISPKSFYLVERSTPNACPDPVSSVVADWSVSFGSGISNSGTIIELKDASGILIDQIDTSSSGWPAGDNTTKETMQKSDSGWITAVATPKAVNSAVSVQEPTEQGPVANQSSSGSVASQYTPPENLPKIKAYAGEDKVTVAGVLSEFRGLAFGLNDEPLEGARYLWNFGDGAAHEGQNIFHYYRYPGEYIVVLDVSSGQYAASDRLKVKAIKNEIFISEAKPGVDSFVELFNPSKHEINISGWIIRFGTNIFVFPKGSFVAPKSYLVVPSLVSGIIFPQGEGVVDLLYPGNFLADSLAYKGFLTAGQSFSKINNTIVFALETPGEENKIVESEFSAAKMIPSSSPSPQKTENKEEKSEQSEEKTEIRPKETAEKEDLSAVNQGANVLSGQKEKTDTKFYFWLVLAVAIISGAGVLLARHKSDVSDQG